MTIAIAEWDLFHAGNTAAAIKLYRERTGASVFTAAAEFKREVRRDRIKRAQGLLQRAKQFHDLGHLVDAVSLLAADMLEDLQ